MAKRARGSTSRPGQRAPLQRTGVDRSPTPAIPTPRPITLTDDEEARAAELEARIVAAERSADEAIQKRERGRRAALDSGGPGRGGSIAIRAAEEYGYVMRDVRKIITIGGSMLAILIGIWVVMQATGTSLT